ncbi:MAG: hypothetical protein IID09_06830 [Candidatus Hydrogenedentes bacterium]|nr:hypothetical protein [Candidatus Hydrogenedentota bacterium]
MAKLSMVRIRGFLAGVFALLLVIVLASVGTAVLGMDVPVLSTIAGFFGVEVAEG